MEELEDMMGMSNIKSGTMKPPSSAGTTKVPAGMDETELPVYLRDAYVHLHAVPGKERKDL